MTSFHLKDSTINYKWLLTSRQRTRCDKTDARRMQESSRWEEVCLPPQTPTKALWGPARGTDHFSLKTVFSCQGCPSQSRQLSRGQAHRWKEPPTLRCQTPAFLLSNNVTKSSSIWIIHFKSLSGFFRFVFFFNDEIIRSVKKLRCCGCIAARWPILPRTRWTEANSGASRRQRKPRPLRTALSPFARPPSSHPEDKGPLSPKKACVSPTPQVQVLQPPAWRLKSRFWLPKRHREPSSKLQRAKKTDFLN